MILSIIIPVFNEERTVANVLDQIVELALPDDFFKEIIVVNDGSSDGTLEIINRYKNINIINQLNGGKGSAVKAGYKACHGDYVIVKDADLEQKPEDIVKLLSHALLYKTDFLIGSRFSGPYKPVSFRMKLHKFINIFFGQVVGLLVGTKINDAWSGYKLLTRKSLEILKENLIESSIEFELESIFIAGKFKIKINEIPIYYNPRWYAEGKKTSYKHALKSFKYLIRVIFKGH